MDTKDLVRELAKKKLLKLIKESNTIEGILREPIDLEVDCHFEILEATELNNALIKNFVWDIAGAKMRCQEGMDVCLHDGSRVVHSPPPGHPGMSNKLATVLAMANDNDDPYEVHQIYESLHPFMDGNGRSGRVIWAWMMLQQEKPFWDRGFLHTWYYQSLSANRIIG